MSNLEHYFENLLYMGKDVTGNWNKDALTLEQQEAVEICYQYIKYTMFCGEDIVAIRERNDLYAWHDLRKDPNDVPSGFCNDNKVLMLLANGKYCTWLDDDSEIIAWKYIEPFERG